MTVYERKTGDICEPYTKSLEVERNWIGDWLQEWFNLNKRLAIMDVTVDEIDVSQYGLFGGEKVRTVGGSAINRDSLTRKYFTFKP